MTLLAGCGRRGRSSLQFPEAPHRPRTSPKCDSCDTPRGSSPGLFLASPLPCSSSTKTKLDYNKQVNREQARTTSDGLILLVFSRLLTDMRRLTNPRTLWATLVLVSGIPRIAGAFFLPNAFGDAYVYIRDIGMMSTKLSAGTFALTDLYGFW